MLENSKYSRSQMVYLTKEYSEKIDSYLTEIKIKNAIYKTIKMSLKPAKLVFYVGAFSLGVRGVALIKNGIASLIGERFFSIAPLTFGATVYFLAQVGVHFKSGKKTLEKLTSETFFETLAEDIERKISANDYLYETLVKQKNLFAEDDKIFKKKIDILQEIIKNTDQYGGTTFINQYSDFIFSSKGHIENAKYANSHTLLECISDGFFILKKKSLIKKIREMCFNSINMYGMNEMIKKGEFISKNYHLLDSKENYNNNESISLLHFKYTDLFETLSITFNNELNYYKNIRQNYQTESVNVYETNPLISDWVLQHSSHSNFVKMKDPNPKINRKMRLEDKKNEIDEKIELCELFIQQINYLYQYKEHIPTLIEFHKFARQVCKDSASYNVDVLSIFLARIINWNLVSNRIIIKDEWEIPIIIQKIKSLLGKDIDKLIGKISDFETVLENRNYNTR